jgi:hypothetical protein
LKYKYSLILNTYRTYWDDFKVIASHIQRIAPEIMILLTDPKVGTVPYAIWLQPTLIVSFNARVNFSPKRGKIYGCCRIEKHIQASMFEKAGIPTPRTALFTLGQQLREDEWGEFVILKPLRINSHGEGIHLVRTARVHQLGKETFASDHPIHHGPYVVQSFIDTGSYPCHYRVLTLMGEALYCRRNSKLQPRPELSADDETLFKTEIATNAGAGPDATTTELVYKPEIIDFAKRMHAAAPDIALMGCDVLRDYSTGRLYALEMNAGGNTWAFSSRLGEKARAILGKENMINQFGAWQIAARMLANKTRAEAQ